jgi:hypothetical protein
MMATKNKGLDSLGSTFATREGRWRRNREKGPYLTAIFSVSL